jgi:Uma2 family endonuclease
VAFSASVTTAEQLARLPDDDCRYELVQGRLRRMSPVGGVHGVVVVRLAAAMAAWVAEHGLGLVMTETGFVLTRDPDTVRAPDLAFVRASRIPTTGVPTGYWTGAPDLAVEVLSPDDRRPDVRERVRDYQRNGARLVWVLDPATREGIVYRTRSDIPVRVEDILDGEDVLPGFRCPLPELFT